MNISLLDKTRKIQRFFHNTSPKIDLTETAGTFAGQMGCSVILVSVSGEILARQYFDPGCEKVLNTYSEAVNAKFLAISSTRENISPSFMGFAGIGLSEYYGLAVPVELSQERQATAFYLKKNMQFDLNDIILAEQSALVYSLLLLNKREKDLFGENLIYDRTSLAIENLSYTELLAVSYVFEELKSDFGIINNRKISDKYSITRSVIISAIKKLESAGVVSAVSRGVKGTEIKILIPEIRQAISKAIDSEQ